MENNNPIVVFDFDKTLTLNDTIAGFYVACNKNISLLWKVPYFFVFVCLHVLKKITNDKLKQIGVKIFLKGKTKNKLYAIGEMYAKKIKFNKIYESEYLKKYPTAIISSASFYEYLQFIFPKKYLLASTLSYNDKNEVVGLKKNMYSNNKVDALKEKKINNIDLLYTDSYSDKPLMDIASITYLVTKNNFTKIV
jgi:phosphoserine phosphatase